jgi:LSD1 subclass zinc finger protein
MMKGGVIMGTEKEGLSTAESLRATRTYGQVRCHNPSCMGRLQPEPGATTVKCSKCGLEWRVAWVKKGFPRIRGPVWDVNKRIAEEVLERKMKEEKKDGSK